DALRCAKLAKDAGLGGALLGPSAYLMKSPAIQYTDEQARLLTEAFIREYGNGGLGAKAEQATKVNGHVETEALPVGDGQ
ncbi:MAG: hypothetical protein ACXVCX_16290, partial [Ktedonobacterales bacterium]